MTVSDLGVIARGLAPLFQAIATRLSALEVKERGIDGETGPRGLEGSPGRDGRDGVSVAGPPGEKGADGLGFDDIHVEHDGERGFTFKFVRGEQVKAFGAFQVPALIYRGVFQEGQTYEKGDAATWGNQTWHANTTTTAKPGTAQKDWTLMVRRGGDGKQGPAGPSGERGPRGEKGEDGRVYR